MVRRPTSPHLGIYRPQISSVMSISHRLTGLGLVAGSLLLACWLWMAAYAPASYASLHACLSSGLGRALMVGWTAAFYYHLGNGVRHLFWDMGKGFSLSQMERSGWAVIAFTLAMTAATWAVAL